VAAGQGHPPSRLVIAKNEATEPEPEDQRTWEERRRGRSCSENKLARGAMAQNSRPQLAFGVGEGETGRNRKTETHRETERNTEINTGAGRVAQVVERLPREKDRQRWKQIDRDARTQREKGRDTQRECINLAEEVGF
jgi:hypothetical protein